MFMVCAKFCSWSFVNYETVYKCWLPTWNKYFDTPQCWFALDILFDGLSCNRNNPLVNAKIFVYFQFEAVLSNGIVNWVNWVQSILKICAYLNLNIWLFTQASEPKLLLVWQIFHDTISLNPSSSLILDHAAKISRYPYRNHYLHLIHIISWPSGLTLSGPARTFLDVAKLRYVDTPRLILELLNICTT